MPDTPPATQPVDDSTRIDVRSHFVRHRNALAVRADFSPLYVDYYLHLMDQGIKHEPLHDQMLKEALAAVVLHAVTRPWKETHAWTLNFQDPLLNLFVTASSTGEALAGRVFTDGVREDKKGLFFSQVTAKGEEPRTSTIELPSGDLFSVVEEFYRQSEQRTAKILRHGEEEFVMISAQPDCDEAWLENLTDEDLPKLEETEEVSPLETRSFRFSCGCTLERIFPALAPLAKQGLDKLFLGDEIITITCPRCAAKWRVTREQMEAVLETH